MTEAEFESALVELAHTFGWSVAGFRPARTNQGWRTPVKWDGAGFPDLVLIHPAGGIIFAELKAGRNRPDPKQIVWGERITAAIAWLSPDAFDTLDEFGYRLWYPTDADDIAHTLSFGRVTEWHLTERRRP